jgi:hypothetical protein
MLDINEISIRLQTRPSVIQRLIDEKLLPTLDRIRAQDVESLRRNNALLVRFSAIRKQVIADEQAAELEAQEQQERREHVTTLLYADLEIAKAAGDYQKMSELQQSLLQLQGDE